MKSLIDIVIIQLEVMFTNLSSQIAAIIEGCFLVKILRN